MMRKLMVMIPIGIGAIAIFTFLGGQIVMRLWNWLMPMVFGLPALTFWQAVGMLALTRILFGGFGMGGGPRHHRKHLTPDERERFRERVRERWGSAAEPSGPSPQ